MDVVAPQVKSFRQISRFAAQRGRELDGQVLRPVGVEGVEGTFGNREGACGERAFPSPARQCRVA